MAKTKVNGGNVFVVAGTSSGVFVLRSDAARGRWEAGGPHLRGHSIDSVAFDGRAGRRRIWAGARHAHWGATLAWSDDLGRTWARPETGAIRFPAESGSTLRRISAIQPGRTVEPDVLYCGTQPAALFVSTDAGDIWRLCDGLFDHPDRHRWEPPDTGASLHSILPDPSIPRRIVVGIAAGGCYRTDDGGASWTARNTGIRAPFLPDPEPASGQCVHRIVAAPEGRMFLRNHAGVYRSDDSGETWKASGKGLPSEFGYAVAAHPRDRSIAWVVPLESEEFPCAPAGMLRVFRTMDGGRTWRAQAEGLPRVGAHETVSSGGLEADVLDPAGLYLGGRSGTVWASRDEGSSWREIVRGLPPVICLKTVVIPEVGKGKR